jgi:dolichol-phosphate mannosyltransferase
MHIFTKIVVIIPTYNERDNIGPLLEALEEECRKIPYDMHILVVDDNSPDGTAEIVREEGKNYSNIHLITGEKQGLGAAYIRGMRYAIEVLNADAIMEMDADFSHKPEDVPRLLHALDEGADFVIGSRYVKGGTIPHDWGLLRKAISKWGNICARYIVGLYKVHDCTAGFRAMRSSVIRKIDLESLGVQGYAFQIALLYRVLTSGARVQEIPVEFIDRARGTTKLGFSDIREFIVHAWWLRFAHSQTFMRFAMVGASGVLVNLGSFTVLINGGLNKFLASPVSIELSIISNFLLNNFWTFSERKTKHRFHIKGLKFNIVSLITLGIAYFTFVMLNLVWPHGVLQLHQALGIIPATLVNYFLNSYWTFRSSPTGD